MTKWSAMNLLVPEGKYGVAEVRHCLPTPFDVMRDTLRGIPSVQETVCQLFVGGTLFMSDSLHERQTNETFVQMATGDVLVFGLGVGMVLPPLYRKPTVRSVTVVELSPDVITLVAPFVADPKLTVVQGDAFTWEPADQKYDTVYFDIWATIPNSDHWPEMKKLKARGRRWLKVRGQYCRCWMEEEAKADARNQGRFSHLYHY